MLIALEEHGGSVTVVVLAWGITRVIIGLSDRARRRSRSGDD